MLIRRRAGCVSFHFRIAVAFGVREYVSLCEPIDEC